MRMIIIITFVVLNENDYHYRFGSLLLLRSSCNKQYHGTTALRHQPGVNHVPAAGVCL